jgi:3-hydroxybutyryl-CoA dehydrogenase
MNIKTVGVIGAGQMGNGIAQVSAMAGFNVVMRDISMDLCKKGLSVIEKSLAKAVEKQKLTSEQRDATLKKIKLTTELKDFKDCDIAIEAATERVD